MSSVFVIQNQQGQFLSRQKEWVENTEISAMYKTPHRDLAINELFEVTSKLSDMRAKVVEAETSEKGLPLVAKLPPLEFPKVELPEDMAWLEGEADKGNTEPQAGQTDQGAEQASQSEENQPQDNTAMNEDAPLEPTPPAPGGGDNPQVLNDTLQVEA